MSSEKMGIGDNVAYILGKLTGKGWSRRSAERVNNRDTVRARISGALRGYRQPEEKVFLRANVHVLHKRGSLVLADYWGENLVTDVGDGHISKRIAEGDTEDIVTGMKLGTGSTAVTKNGVDSDMEAYISGSEEALDSAPADATKGAGAGWRTTFVCTWIAGDVTNATINEVCLTNQTALADNTSAEADTIARFVFGSTIDKQSGDSLEVTWQIDILGA